MRKLPSTPEHLKATLQNHAKNCLKGLKHELDPEQGWSELFSLDSKNKELIHKFIDTHYHVSRLFRKVSNHVFLILSDNLHDRLPGAGRRGSSLA